MIPWFLLNCCRCFVFPHPPCSSCSSFASYLFPLLLALAAFRGVSVTITATDKVLISVNEARKKETKNCSTTIINILILQVGPVRDAIKSLSLVFRDVPRSRVILFRPEEHRSVLKSRQSVSQLFSRSLFAVLHS